MGAITTWDDPAIKAENPNLNVPAGTAIKAAWTGRGSYCLKLSPDGIVSISGCVQVWKMTARKTFVCQGSVLVLGTGRSSNRRIQQHHRIYRSKLTATYLTSLLQSLKWFWRSLKLICLSHHFSLSAEGYLNSECSADWTLGSGSTVAWPAQFNKVPGLRTYQHVACCHVQVSLLEKAKKQQLPRLRSPRFKALVECRPSLQTTCMRLVPCSDQVVGDDSSFGGQLGLSKVQHVLSWTFMRLRWCWPRSSAWFARGEPEEQGKHLAHFQGCFGSHWLWRQQRCRCSRWGVREFFFWLIFFERRSPALCLQRCERNHYEAKRQWMLVLSQLLLATGVP